MVDIIQVVKINNLYINPFKVGEMVIRRDGFIRPETPVEVLEIDGVYCRVGFPYFDGFHFHGLQLVEE